MFRLEVELGGSAEQLLFALRAGRFDSYRVPLQGAIARLLRRVLRQNFEERGSFATPRPWAPLARSTIRDRIRQGYGGKPMMRRTDRLYRSLTLQRASADGVFEVTDDSITLGSRVEYAQYHQRGNAILPRRQLIPDPMPTWVGDECRRILREWLLEGKGA
jgi:phage gpG-like protein